MSLALSTVTESMSSAMQEQRMQAMWATVAGIQATAYEADPLQPRSVARAKKWLKHLAAAYSMVPGWSPLVTELLQNHGALLTWANNLLLL